ncbi:MULTISPECIES: HK97 family phage prohead protease [Streptomyces]|uniref:Caudovirus prohead protease n=1 Tax=Streptomyces fradiae ATCC 10745 = DSM 40063 TaxID=1319510 RepID=A0A1Y2NTR0_STRFR|nr:MULTISPECIES: HK97 family phage prohead protease [Streptomyces]OSY50601.1 Caudovirus prohead protease [Streptomyces fradiae ATCC 10745 = DSM 40063]QEV11627.1 HK97 family phage prohead protease [Streptomyces fradiae ATCC 10745 = DSM 40063]
MRIKSCPVRIKAAGEHEGTDEGTFEAIVAAYNLDSVGDKITPGAFADTLAEWKGRGDPIPVLWSHMSQDPDYHIGEVLEAEERPEGLWVKARIDTEPGSKAAQVYKLLKGRRVTQFSFAYDVEEGAWVDQKDGEGYYELRKLRLYEVGPTLIGANQATELLDVKSSDGATMRIAVEGASAAQADELRQALTGAMAAKAGRTLSAKNEERVKEIARLAKELLDSLSSSTDDEEKATPNPPETPSPQPAAKEAPAGPSPASLRLLADLNALGVEVSTLTD